MKLKQIRNRQDVNMSIAYMAEEIYDIGPPLAIIAILKGGAYVAYEILKLLNDFYEEKRIGFFREGEEKPDVIIGHIGLESYGDKMKSSGEVKLMTPLDLSRDCIRGRTVIIVDDCIETGTTFDEATKIVAGYEPHQLYTAVLVDKITLRGLVRKPDIVGWTYLGSGFLVGCGMGMGEEYRGLREICEVVEDN